jgi:photosynthetic reaction center H subunit
MHAAITSQIDIAQLTLYAFWIFFAGLIIYLRGEDKREGYPLHSDTNKKTRIEGFPKVPKPKTFILPHGGTVTYPRVEALVPITTAKPANPWPGAPLHPIGDPMLAAVGPGSYANRADVPDAIYDTGLPKIVPLRSDALFTLAKQDADPRGMKVYGADRKVAGTVSDVWVDRAEFLARYLEVEIPATFGSRKVLVPVPAAVVDGSRRRVVVDAILSTQFANVPATKSPDVVTLLEEDKISAYYAAGRLYATRARQEPLI